MHTKIINIDRSIAEMLLSMNTKNRPLDMNRAKRISEAIKRGEWQLNGDAIRVSVNGVLLDGQHRLMAIKMSGVTVQSFLIEGLPNDVFKTIDTNARSRKASDILAIEGEKHYNVLAASAVFLYFYSKNKTPYNTQSASIYPTPTQIKETITENPDLRESANITAGFKWCKKYIVASVTVFCHCIFMQKDKEKALEFFNQLESGTGLVKGSPVLALRNRLMMDSTDKKTKISKNYKIALVFKAFKHFLAKTEVLTLRVRIDGDAAEKDVYVL